jgi:predicted O-methyltransferase YrrM
MPEAAPTTVVAEALARSSETDLDRISPPIERGPWSMHLDALSFLVTLVHLVRPRHVVEFGSGLSTRVVAWACAESTRSGRITTVDNDPDSSRAAEEGLEQQAVKCDVEFRTAPLVLRDCGGEMLPVYLLRRDEWVCALPADLLVIDGPADALGGRGGTLYQALDFSHDGTVVILDDADRPGEQAIVASWTAMLGSAIELERLDLTGGMVAIAVRRPVRLEDLWYHRVRSVTSRVAELVRRAPVVLLDGDSFGDEFWTSDVARRAMPFTKHGTPADSQAAMAELERARANGAAFAVVAWPAFWWLEHYEVFAHYLETRYQRYFSDPALVVYDLRT